MHLPEKLIVGFCINFIIFVFCAQLYWRALPTKVTHTNEAGAHPLSWHESFGFFDDSDEDWARVKQILIPLRREDMALTHHTKHAHQFFDRHWNPQVSCRFAKPVGRLDGTKWLCDPHRVQKGNCLVYSIGGNNEWSFERRICDEWQCEVHTFDPTIKVIRGKPEGTSFHNIGLPVSNTSQTVFGYGTLMPLDGIIRSLGHSEKWIDFLKVDCEEGEFSLIDLLNSGYDLKARQILMEVHFFTEASAEKVHNLLLALAKAGYAIFHKQINLGCQGGRCAEYGFIKLNIPENVI